MAMQWARVATATLSIVLLGLPGALGSAGCNSKIIISDAGSEATIDFGNATGALDLDATLLSPEAEAAFFVDDAPPPYCGPNGERQEPKDPGGTSQCPGDKNRQGCPCPEPGMEAPCWPGRRNQRHQGICTDGTTVCEAIDEFGNQWGPCEGYVLPEEDAETGPEACKCFSNGSWKLDNLVPCLQEKDDNVFLYSSSLDSSGNYRCETLPSPPPAPDEAWADSILNIDCAGRFELCYTIKAGDEDAPQPDDCVIMRQCFDLWYEEPGADHPLELKGWSSTDGACGRRFERLGGYGEMTVLGRSASCEEVTDDEGNPRVFFRTNYCPPDCGDRPDDPECQSCTTGGAGDF